MYRINNTQIDDAEYIDIVMPMHNLIEYSNSIYSYNLYIAYDSIMCGCFCTGFINFMFNGKTLTDYTNLFSPNDFKKNDDIVLNYFKNNTFI